MRKNKKRKFKIKNQNQNQNKQQLNQEFKKKEIQKKDYIIFRYGIGHLLFFQKHSNVFFVLTTETNEHLVTLTGGSCHLGRTRKQKVSPFNISLMIKELKRYCSVYDVTRIRFFLRSSINKHYYNIIKYLALNDLKVMEIGYVLHMAHSNVRGRKPRRI